MQIKRTEVDAMGFEHVTVLDGAQAQRALCRIADINGCSVDSARNELAAGLRLSTYGAFYEATVAPVCSEVLA